MYGGGFIPSRSGSPFVTSMKKSQLACVAKMSNEGASIAGTTTRKKRWKPYRMKQVNLESEGEKSISYKKKCIKLKNSAALTRDALAPGPRVRDTDTARITVSIVTNRAKSAKQQTFRTCQRILSNVKEKNDET